MGGDPDWRCGLQSCPVWEVSHILSPSQAAPGLRNPSLDAFSPCGFTVLISQRLSVFNETLGEEPREDSGSFLFPMLVLILAILCCYFLV